MGKRNKSGLTANQQIFADEYLKDRNGARAYKVAYKHSKKDETARVNASRLLTNANIINHINTQLEKICEKAQINAERALKEEARLAFSDIRDLFNENGTLIAPNELPDEIALAIAGFEVIERVIIKNDDEQVVERKYKYRIWDKGQSLKRLETLLGMLIERKEITGKDGAPIKFEDVKHREDLRAKGDKLLEMIKSDG